MAGNSNERKYVQNMVFKYLADIEEKDNYFTGWIDGEERLKNFVWNYEVEGSMSFKLRSSALRGSAKRYGNEGRYIYVRRFTRPPRIYL